MPVVSKAQFRMMQAAAHGNSSKVPSSVARQYLAATPKGALSGLPARKKKKEK